MALAPGAGRWHQPTGSTYDPEAIEGHMGVEALQVLQPPLVCVCVGEVGEGSVAWPDLQGSHRAVVQQGRTLRGRRYPEALSVLKDPGLKQAIKAMVKSRLTASRAGCCVCSIPPEHLRVSWRAESVCMCQ